MRISSSRRTRPSQDGRATISGNGRAWHPRQGAVLVMVALMSMMLIGLLAIALDFSRAYAQKNEMQTSADAAALAGVLELYQDPLTVVDSAVAFGQSNKVQTYVLGSNRYAVVCGVWDDEAAPAIFTPSGNCSNADNAVQVQAIDTVQYLFNDLFSLTKSQQTTTATAWMAYIEGATCVKPWAIRYTLLTKSLQPLNLDTLRDLTEADIDSLQTLPRERLRFMLKSGDTGDPGNYGSLEIPNADANGNPYEENIATCNNALIKPGDTVQTEPGIKVGPTKQGAAQFCEPLVGEECQNGQGEMGKLSIAALWWSQSPIVNGRRDIVIEQLVSFNLDSVTSSAEIIGVFTAGVSGGSIGSRPGTIRRPVLVR